MRQSERDLRAAGEGVGAEEMRAGFLNMRTANGAAGGLLNLLCCDVIRYRAENFGDYVVAPANEHL